MPTLAALILLIIAGILAILGLATPNWHNQVQTTTISTIPKIRSHHGIWATCSNIGYDVFDCGAHSEPPGYLLAVRAMEILAVLCGASCILIAGIWAFLKVADSKKQIMAIAYLITGFLAGLFGLLGIIIYAAELHSTTPESDPGVFLEYQLSWSFGLATVAAVLTCIATALLGVGWRMIK